MFAAGIGAFGTIGEVAAANGVFVIGSGLSTIILQFALVRRSSCCLLTGELQATDNMMQQTRMK
jgi:hypothetical protein